MFAKQMIESTVKTARQWLLADQLLLQGRLASWHIRPQAVIDYLADIEFKVTSQWGQDGIIDWLIERAQIPASAQSFIEFGVEDYRQANTRFLLQNRNWRGLILDGNSALLTAIERDKLAWKHDLTALQAFITRENINGLIANAGFHGEVGLLSIDVDGNDYWIWEAIEAIQPILCICEYNAVFGDVHPISIPYDSRFHRTSAHYSNLYFGASIAALRFLGACKGYRFVGTNSAANDAFFVREDYARRFVDQSIRHIAALPSRFRESRDEHGRPTHLGGLCRLKEIAGLPVVKVESGESVRLDELDPIYSQEWLRRMTGAAGEPAVAAATVSAQGARTG